MSFEPPPDPESIREEKKYDYKKTSIVETCNIGYFKIRKAQVSDVRGILELINRFAASNLMLARGPRYLYENIRDFTVVVDPESMDTPTSGKIIACGSLHVLWEDMAEIRSIAIHPDFQRYGLGKNIVESMRTEAKQLGIKKLFTFTLTEAFFASLGFKCKDKKELPPKVWGECSRCPKYFKCDEIGMTQRI